MGGDPNAMILENRDGTVIMDGTISYESVRRALDSMTDCKTRKLSNLLLARLGVLDIPKRALPVLTYNRAMDITHFFGYELGSNVSINSVYFMVRNKKYAARKDQAMLVIRQPPTTPTNKDQV